MQIIGLKYHRHLCFICKKNSFATTHYWGVFVCIFRQYLLLFREVCGSYTYNRSSCILLLRCICVYFHLLQHIIEVYFCVFSDSISYTFGSSGGLIHFAFAENDIHNSKQDQLALGFITDQKDAILTRIDSRDSEDFIEMELVSKPRFLMSDALIFGYETNKNSSTPSKLCTCYFLNFLKFQNIPISIVANSNFWWWCSHCHNDRIADFYHGRYMTKSVYAVRWFWNCMCY